MLSYFSNLGYLISVTINVIAGGNLHQTISARNFQNHLDGKFNLVLVIDLIFFWQKNHCETSWLYWKQIMMIIYGKEKCPYCEWAKDLATKLGAEFEYKDVHTGNNLAELKSLVPDVKTVPQIFIDDKLIGGYTEYLEYTKAK